MSRIVLSLSLLELENVKVLRNTKLSGLQIPKLICQVVRLMAVAPFTLHVLAGYDQSRQMSHLQALYRAMFLIIKGIFKHMGSE